MSAPTPASAAVLGPHPVLVPRSARRGAAVALMLGLLGGALAGCQGGSVSDTPMARCYPEGACDESMFTTGLRADLGDVAAGKVLFDGSCASCHGVDGKGTPKTQKVDFTSAVWHAGVRDVELARRIARGTPPVMPPFTFTEHQMRDVISYVRSLQVQPASARPDGSGY